MRAVHEASMQDICILLRRTVAQDESGQEIAAYQEVGPWPCGLHVLSRQADREVRTEGALYSRTWAVLRLPLEQGATVKAWDRVRITNRYGVSLPEPLEYGIDGDPEPGAFAVTVHLLDIR